MIVVDTNVISYFFLPNEQLDVVQQLFQQDSEWIVPMLWRSEFRNVLSQYMRRQLMPFFKAQAIMRTAEGMLQGREYHVASAQVLELVYHSSCTAYDCEFVALAQDAGVPLVTFDKKVLREFPATAVAPAQFLI